MTIKDIAAIAGVSHSTVSRALNDHPLISDETKRKIREIAQEHNFEFNAAARSLSKRKTGMIAVIYKSNLDVFGSSLYASQLFLDLRHSLEEHQLDAILLEAYNPVNGESNISRIIRQNKVDGFLLVHSDIPEEDYRLIRDHDLPVVQLHLKSYFFPLEQLDYYLTDNERGGYLAGKHMVERGCRKMIAVGVTEKVNDEYKYRTKGFERALGEAGLTLHRDVVFIDCSYDAAYRFVKENEELLRSVDGIFVQADILAWACLIALKELGINVPEDLKLVGFDDSAVATVGSPAITTIHQPREEISHRACKRIDELVKGTASEEPEQIFIEPELIIRETS